MNALTVVLDSFDEASLLSLEGGTDSPKLRQIKEEAYQAGFEAAKAEANALRQSDTAFGANLDRAFFSLCESYPQEAAKELSIALKALAHAVLPRLASKGLGEEVAATVLQHVSEPSAPHIRIDCAPERIDEIQNAVNRIGINEAVTVEGDDNLDASQVDASWRFAGIEVNVEKAAEDALKALDDLAVRL